ncbi:hypothetical protein OAB83_00580 [Candidatus Pelagibacter sp.]|nr:hypothetical protein [Candidatus Pelagibacter sp.]
MNKKVLVCYLFTAFDNQKTLINFIKYYKINSTGVNHKLLICFKLLGKQKIIFFRKLLKDIKYIEFIDPVSLNDFDFGSYKRVAKSYPSHVIFFLNSHSYPIKKYWLKIILKHYKNNTILGTTASYESAFSSLRLKKFYKIISYIFRFYKFKNSFKAFPNPHIRTSSFLIKGSDFISFIKNKKINNKEDTWSIESGLSGLTNFFKKKKYNIFVINSDGVKFTENSWKLSETYIYLKQSKSLISDKHSRKYLKLSTRDKLYASKISWGE